MAGALEWLFGFHAVESALRNDPENVERVLIEQGRQDRRVQGLLGLVAQAPVVVPVERLPGPTLARRVGSPKHQGVACGYRQPVARNEQDLFAELERSESVPLLLVLDGVTDPHNLGACLRTADAAGAFGVIVPRDRAVGLTPVVRKVASGAAESLPLYQVTNLARVLQALRDRGIWVVGAAGEAEISLYDCPFAREPLALVMGAEGRGLRRLTRTHCDQLLHIPMAGRVESLNVSAATAVCLFEFRRRRLLPS
ncbi:MAG: 23S rRNA (guanosine(2251)-2'-O)-methyltransferase RlmB [Halothiobacillaceae bacterium]